MSTINLDEFYEYYSSGVQINALAKHYGITRREVFQYVQKNGWRQMIIRSKPKWSVYLVRSAIAKILAGKPKRIRPSKTQDQKEKAALYSRAYYHEKRKNPEYLKQTNERSKARYQSKKIEILKYRKEWAARNKSKVKQLAQRWYADNKHRAKANSDARRARRVNATIGDTKQIARWERRWKKQPKVRCYWCGINVNPDKCDTDHIVALALGGAHEIGNLCVSCSTCNNQKHAKPVSEWNKVIQSPVLL